MGSLCSALDFGQSKWSVVHNKDDVFRVEQFNFEDDAMEMFKDLTRLKVSRILVSPNDCVMAVWMKEPSDKGDLRDFFKSETGRTLKVRRLRSPNEKIGSQRSKNATPRTTEFSNREANSPGSIQSDCKSRDSGASASHRRIFSRGAEIMAAMTSDTNSKLEIKPNPLTSEKESTFKRLESKESAPMSKASFVNEMFESEMAKFENARNSDLKKQQSGRKHSNPNQSMEFKQKYYIEPTKDFNKKLNLETDELSKKMAALNAEKQEIKKLEDLVIAIKKSKASGHSSPLSEQKGDALQKMARERKSSRPTS